MGRSTAEQIKSMVDLVFGIADKLETRGLSFHHPIYDGGDNSLRELVKADMLLFIIRLADNNGHMMSEDCLSYINECLDYNFTPLAFEVARKRSLESGIPGTCLILPLLLLVDRTLGGERFSAAYVRALSYVMIGYLKTEDHNTLEKMVKYYRLSDGCVRMIENTLGEKVDFDPLDSLSKDAADVIRMAAEIDRSFHPDDPVITSIEDAIRKTLEGIDKDQTEMAGVAKEHHRKVESPAAEDRMTLTNKDIRAYRPMDLPYHYVLFHHMDDVRYLAYKSALGGSEEDNALLTYCYLDKQAGLSYRAICMAVLTDDGRVEYRVNDNAATNLIIREGGIESPAELIDEDDPGMVRFRKVAERIKENYGYHKEKTTIREDIPFGKQRHPAYPDDIMVLFISPEHKKEQIWVREQSREGDRVIATLLNEPYDLSFGLHEGDTVTVIPVKDPDGEVIPMAMLDWMKKQGNI